MRDNIQIVKSTINNFNSTIYKLNQNEIKLNTQINNLNEIFSQITKTENSLLYTSKLNNLLNIIEGSLLSISNLLDTTLSSILFSKLNILHPSVISPLSLYNELSKHSNYMNKKLDFPVPLSIRNIHSIIDVSRLSSYYYNNKVIFVLLVPLITADRFMVYKTLPLPTPHDDSFKTFALIQPSSSYIALSDDRMHYAMLDTLDKCRIIDSNYSICELTTLYSCLSSPNCESKILTEVTLSLPSECNAKIVYGQIDIWQKLRNNKWIFVQSVPNKLTIRCDDNIVDHSIIGTGIVKLASNCIGYSKTIQLNPSNSYVFLMKSSLDINFDITVDDCCKRDTFNKSLPYLTPISLSKINLDTLKYTDHQLNNLEQELNNVEKESHFIKYGPYYSTFTYILIVSLFLYLAYKIYNYFRRRRSNTNSGYCVQIFNQCYNNKANKTKSRISNSIEMIETSSSSNDDSKSVKSLPTHYRQKHTSRVQLSSNRSLNF